MKAWRKLKENPKLWPRYLVREKVIKAIRKFFDGQGFHEVETPILIANPPAESYLDVFETTLYDRHRKPTRAYLSTSPEVALKKLMVAGLGNCYAITKSFRNMETQSKLHNPEFTILEWYRKGATYLDIIKDCEELLLSIHSVIPGLPRNPSLSKTGSRLKGRDDETITYQGKTIDLSLPWERLSVADAFKKYAHVDFNDFFKHAEKIAQEKGYTKGTWEELFNQIFLNEIEPHLGQKKPTILYDFPGALGALAKKSEKDPRFAERFECYIAGLELGDCYSELTDAKEQQERFEKEMKEIKKLGKTTYEYDKDFIEALKVGLPKCAGIAVGVDRLAMLFADVADIHDIIFN